MPIPTRKTQLTHEEIAARESARAELISAGMAGMSELSSSRRTYNALALKRWISDDERAQFDAAKAVCDKYTAILNRAGWNDMSWHIAINA